MSGSEGLVFRDRGGWRRWLEENHSAEDGAWVIIYKKGSRKEGLRYEEAVDEAVCFGWIDSRMNSLDGIGSACGSRLGGGGASGRL